MLIIYQILQTINLPIKDKSNNVLFQEEFKKLLKLKIVNLVFKI